MIRTIGSAVAAVFFAGCTTYNTDVPPRYDDIVGKWEQTVELSETSETLLDLIGDIKSYYWQLFITYDEQSSQLTVGSKPVSGSVVTQKGRDVSHAGNTLLFTAWSLRGDRHYRLLLDPVDPEKGVLHTSANGVDWTKVCDMKRISQRIIDL